MKFTLFYDGELPSSANGSSKKSHKWEIRKKLKPQLQQLWFDDSDLKVLWINSLVDEGQDAFWSPPKKLDSHGPWYRRHLKTLPPGKIDLCEPKRYGRYEFYPLVRKSLHLTCSLKIIFLRHEPPGRVYQGGDIDGRIKTLLDALSVPPDANQLVKDDPPQNPYFCLLEDDALVSGLTIDTQKLLGTPQETPKSEVRLHIEVDVRVTKTRYYNTMFLGDGK